MLDDIDSRLALALLEWQAELGVTEPIGETPVDRFAEAQAARTRSSAGVAQAPGDRMPAGPLHSGPSSSAANPAGHMQPGARHVGTALPEAGTTAPSEGGRGPMVPGPMPLSPIPQDAAEAEAALAAARAAATGAQTMQDLRAALEGFEHCALRRGARSTVFSDGTPGAPLMIVGEAPGRDEDREGRPFVGRAGQLLDRMLAAIGRSRTDPSPQAAVYITNVLPWRPPQNREPTPQEIAMLLPFLTRHVELAAPQVLLVLGNSACQALLGRRGVTRLRGSWTEVQGRPAMPSFHPAYLLRNPHAKREAWADLLEVRARLRDLAPGMAAGE